MFRFSVLLFAILSSSAQAFSSDDFRAGLQALQQGRLPDAETALLNASHASPENGAVWIALAETEFRLGKQELAAGDAVKAQQFANDNPVVLHLLALYYAEAKQFDKAAQFESSSAGIKNTPAAYDRAARYFMEAGKTAEAAQTAAKAATDPDIAFGWARVFLQQRDFTDAATVLEAGTKAQPENAQLLLALGVARYGERRFDDAITQFLHVIQIDASIPQPYEFLGRMLDQAGPRLTDITRLFRSHADQNPDNASALLLLAKALLASDPESAEAERLLRRSISLNDSDWESHYELGVLLERKHSYPDSATELASAVRLKESEPAPHYHLARVYARLGETDKAAEERAAHARLTGGKP